MKKLLFLFLTVNCVAQAPTIEWQKNYGGTGADISGNFTKTSDGGYIFTGNTFSSNGNITSNHGASDVWVVKTDANGVIQWQKTYGGTNHDVGVVIRQTSDGGYVIAGLTASSNGDVTSNYGPNDYWILKIDGNGIKQWDKSVGGSSNEFATDIVQTADGGYLVSGSSTSSDFDSADNHGGEWDAMAAKLDASGNVVWHKSYGGTGIDWGGNILPTPDGNYILCCSATSNNGNVTGNHGAQDGWLVKIDTNGTILWQKTYGGTSSDSLIRGINAPDGGYIFIGTTYSVNGDVTSNHGGGDIWVIKTDVSGATVWQKTYGGSNLDNARNIIDLGGTGYLVGGSSSSSDFDTTANRGATDAWLFKIDLIGNLVWQKSYGGSSDDTVDSMVKISDGNYLFFGTSKSSDHDVASNNGENDFWIVKLSPEELSNENFNTQQLVIFPNPASETISLAFSDKNLVADKITVRDMLGKAVLVQSGSNTPIDTVTLSKGVYTLEANSGQNKYLAKFIKQ